jgi:hypothetical protein
MKNSVHYLFFYPSLRALEWSPHSALPFLTLALARVSKGRLDCELHSKAEDN